MDMIIDMNMRLLIQDFITDKNAILDTEVRFFYNHLFNKKG